MKLQLVFLLLISPLLLSQSCESETIDPNPDCPERVEISSKLYAEAPSDELSILSAVISGDCLEIEFTASGCDGSAWEIKLIDADVIMESYPVQRNIRISLKNQEECDAVITKELSFDISPLQLDYDKILLNLTNSGDQLLYEY